MLSINFAKSLLSSPGKRGKAYSSDDSVLLISSSIKYSELKLGYNFALE